MEGDPQSDWQDVRIGKGTPRQSLLGQLTKKSDEILILRRGKSGLNRAQEDGPSGKLTVPGEPLKPSESRAFNDERGDEQSFASGIEWYSKN